MPQKLSQKLRKTSYTEEEGWGRLKVSAQIGQTIWLTALWYDSKYKSYLLPLKKSVRIKENLTNDKKIKVILKFE